MQARFYHKGQKLEVLFSSKMGLRSSTLQRVSINQVVDQETVKRKRNDQGNHECEVLGQGPEAAESAYAWENCTKNHGHPNFIHASDFDLKHLPKWCTLQTVVDFVRTIAALTVRLRVAYTSWGRPEGYSFSNHRGSKVVHTGTGWVRFVSPGSGPCQCFECRESSTPRQTWFKLNLETACHVVYNTEEAQATKVDFFYDDDKKAKNKGKFKTTQAIEVQTQDADGDTCTLVCATHDEKLASTLLAHLEELGKIKFFGPPKVWSLPGWQNLCIVVSHPHGQPKKVTVGSVAGPVVEGTRRYLTYNTDTCPGSSGAPVLLLKFDEIGLCKYSTDYPSLLPPHSRYVSEEGVNQSSATSTAYPESYYPLKQHQK